jgi:hypothetical protein
MQLCEGIPIRVPFLPSPGSNLKFPGPVADRGESTLSVVYKSEISVSKISSLLKKLQLGL